MFFSYFLYYFPKLDNHQLFIIFVHFKIVLKFFFVLELISEIKINFVLVCFFYFKFDFFLKQNSKYIVLFFQFYFFQHNLMVSLLLMIKKAELSNKNKRFSLFLELFQSFSFLSFLDSMKN